jgi:hypothetical protein
MTEISAEFSVTSNAFNKSLSKADRQEAGIYFTPRQARDLLWAALRTSGASLKPKKILEPSAGSGEFIADAIAKYPRAQIDGVEFNQELSTASTNAYSSTKVQIFNEDFLTYDPATKYDLIIGNPPYFQTKAKDPRCMTGRGNIFVQFIYKCLSQHLSTDGILAFVLPTSFYNCAYYEPCRKYIAAQHTILHVSSLGSTPWFETAQDTMILIVQNKPPQQQNFIFTPRNTNLCYITPHAEALVALTQGATTFAALQFDVKTGGIVWSEHKHGNSKKKREFELSDNPEDELLIYSGNIQNGDIVLFAEGEQRNGKKQYICGSPAAPQQGPAFLIARGYGNTSYKLDYGFIPEGMKFHAENHLNVISAKEPLTEEMPAAICESLDSENTKKFLEMFVGNGALSASELLHVFPLWI